MPYSQNMKDEKTPTKRVLLPEGPRAMEVIGVTYGTSKSGNPQFIFTLKDNLTASEVNFYCVDVAGKRGNLKMMLDACEISVDDQGQYNWDDPDVIGAKVVCDIVHEANDYINRKGENITGKQHRIAEIKSFSPSDLAWEE